MEDSFCYQTELELPKNETSTLSSLERSNEFHVVAAVHNNDENAVQVPIVPQSLTVLQLWKRNILNLKAVQLFESAVV